ncbi:Flp family type IVb pilin [Burkholderia contaminans]|uniref:Flp family type IVb pilin n=1 Tax=Burkholderia sp. D-99 TaxID=2717316 RepID=UPI00142031AC|nr:Flp family type IVb pilin [Burkholderia sp. D-99]MBZ5788861.1 Flp family type IVb pilin [Burkholderia contaminans]NHV28163.1 Flp family type IVb pilin [Burkholderia sp. D-99]
MQTRVRVANPRIDAGQRVPSIESACLAATFVVVMLGNIVTPKGSLANTYAVIATAVTAAVATALAMVS